MTILVEMAVRKVCEECGKAFSCKSNLNRHIASVHMKKDKKKEKEKEKNVHKDVNLMKKTKHGLHIQTLNNVLWNIVLQLIENKRLTTGLSTRRKITLI